MKPPSGCRVPPQGVGSPVPRLTTPMPAGTTIRAVPRICLMLAGTALALAGGVAVLHGLLGSKPLPTLSWPEVLAGIGALILGAFLVGCGKRKT